MTTHELARKLLELKDVIAVVRDERAGYDEVDHTREQQIIKYPLSFGYYSPLVPITNGEIIDAVVIL